MHDMLNNWLGAFCRAWERGLNFPLPEKLRKIAVKHGKIQESAAFVLTGWLAGIVIAVAGSVVHCFFSRFNRAAPKIFSETISSVKKPPDATL